MGERITDSDLRRVIESLNSVSKVKYVQNDAYGYAQLAAHVPSSAGCISNMSLGNTKKELYYQIQFCLDWIGKEQNKSYHNALCVHYDNFNSPSEFRDRGLVHEYDKKITCGSCGKKFDKAGLVENHLPTNGHGKTKILIDCIQAHKGSEAYEIELNEAIEAGLK